MAALLAFLADPPDVTLYEKNGEGSSTVTVTVNKPRKRSATETSDTQLQTLRQSRTLKHDALDNATRVRRTQSTRSRSQHPLTTKPLHSAELQVN